MKVNGDIFRTDLNGMKSRKGLLYQHASNPERSTTDFTGLVDNPEAQTHL